MPNASKRQQKHITWVKVTLKTYMVLACVGGEQCPRGGLKRTTLINGLQDKLSAHQGGSGSGRRRRLLEDKAFARVDKYAGGEGAYSEWAFDVKMAVGAQTRLGKRAAGRWAANPGGLPPASTAPPARGIASAGC